MQNALSSFYENDGENEESQSVSVPTSRRNEPASDSSPEEGKKSKPKNKTKNTKFATLHTLNSSSEEEEEGQAFYAGGSEHSGQQVLGPSKKKDFVADMFKSVKE